MEIGLDIDYAPARQYAFTLRRTYLKKGAPTEDDYFKHLEKFVNKGLCTIIDSCFEFTSGLHMHGILEIPKTIPIIHFRVRGWSMKLEELYNPDGWRYYMMKDQKCRQEQDDEESLIDEKPLNLNKSLFKDHT